MSRRVKKALRKNVQVLNARDEIANANHGHEEDVGVVSDIFHVDLRFGGCDVSEVFSVPRICPVAGKKGLHGGKSYDIHGGWDFLNATHRKRCLDELRKEKPRHVHMSPPCGPYSLLMNLRQNRQDCEEQKRKRLEAEVLLHFAMQVCQLQIDGGRTFSFEHPVGAGS